MKINYVIIKSCSVRVEIQSIVWTSNVIEIEKVICIPIPRKHGKFTTPKRKIVFKYYFCIFNNAEAFNDNNKAFKCFYIQFKYYENRFNILKKLLKKHVFNLNFNRSMINVELHFMNCFVESNDDQSMYR